MTLFEAKDQILHLADVRRHMEYAGFRKATYGNRWYCGFHDDGNASVTVRYNKAHCWSGCNKLFDIIEIEAQATGESFSQVVKRLSHDYGIDLDREKPIDPQRKLAIQMAWRRDSVSADLWKIGMLDSLRGQLEYQKNILFPFYGLNEESAHMVRQLTGRIESLDSYNHHRTVEAYREHRQAAPRIAAAMVKLGNEDDANARAITQICCEFLQTASPSGQDSTGAARYSDGCVDSGATQ